MEVSVKSDIQAPAAEVWGVIGDFNGLPLWSPAIKTSRMDGEGVGAVRHIDIIDGRRLSERLETYDPENMTFSYSIIDGPRPVPGYLATIAVAKNGAASTVTWACAGEPEGISEEELRAKLSRICARALKALKGHCELEPTHLD